MHMRRTIRLALAASSVAGVLSAATAQGQDTTITQDQIPPKVADAVKEYGKGGTFVKAVKGDEDGVPVYEVTLDNKGTKTEVQTTLDGELNMREEVIDGASLPKAAADRVMKAHPGAKIQGVERTIRTIYEVRFSDPKGKQGEALVTPGGQLTSEPEEIEKASKSEKGEAGEADEKEEKEGSRKPKGGKHEMNKRFEKNAKAEADDDEKEEHAKGKAAKGEKKGEEKD